MTKDKQYNRCFFETLKSLPDYYKKVIRANSKGERRNILDQMYADTLQKITARAGSFLERDVDGSIIRESKGSIPIRPSCDIEMLVHWDNIKFHDGIPHIIEMIKKEQLKKYINNKIQSLNEISEDNYTRRK